MTSKIITIVRVLYNSPAAIYNILKAWKSHCTHFESWAWDAVYGIDVVVPEQHYDFAYGLGVVGLKSGLVYNMPKYFLLSI